MKQHIILGTDRRHAETERDKWLAENPGMADRAFTELEAKLGLCDEEEESFNEP
jgi:hypothetical protein